MKRCRSRAADPVNLGDLGLSIRALGDGAILTPERQDRTWMLWLGSEAKEPYILVASLHADAANELLQKFRAFGQTMVTEPIHVHEGALTLDFVAIRRPHPPAKTTP